MPCQDSCGPVALQLVVFGLTNGAVTALNAVGFTLAFAVARQFNLAHGNVFALTTVAVAWGVQGLGVTAATPPAGRLVALLTLLVGAVAFGAALNWGVERLAFRPFRRSGDPLAPLIASVALAFVLLGVAVRWHTLTSEPRPGHQGVNLPYLAVPDLLPETSLLGGFVQFTVKDLLVLVLAGLVVGGLALLLQRSRTGRLIRATAQDPELAALLGGNPARAQALAFALAGGLAGFGAAIFATYYGGATTEHGLRSGLAAMTASILGGIGDPRGALLGGLVIGVLSSFSDYALDAHWTPVIVLVLLIGLLAFRPRGLLGEPPNPVGTSADRPPTLALRDSPGGLWLFGGLVILGAVFPALDARAGLNGLYAASSALLLVTLALGLGIVVGLAGLLDLGYAAFFAIGSYTAAILTSSGSPTALTLPAIRQPWLGLGLAGLVAATFGVLFGVPSVRTRGEYLAIVTLAFGEIVPSVIVHLPDLTGGPRGMSGIPPPGLWDSGPLLSVYLVTLGAVVLIYLGIRRLIRARVGRAWAAIRDDELAAQAVGIDPPRLKLLAFAVGAACAGAAGALFAGLFGYVEPAQFDLTLSLMVLAAVVVGGRWGLVGVVGGALVIALYDRVVVDFATQGVRAVGAGLDIPELLSADLRGDNFTIFGLALYLAVRFRGRSSRTE